MLGERIRSAAVGHLSPILPPIDPLGDSPEKIVAVLRVGKGLAPHHPTKRHARLAPRAGQRQNVAMVHLLAREDVREESHFSLKRLERVFAACVRLSRFRRTNGR